MFLANITAHKAVTNVITAHPVLSAAMASTNQAKPEHHALLTAELLQSAAMASANQAKPEHHALLTAELLQRVILLVILVISASVGSVFINALVVKFAVVIHVRMVVVVIPTIVILVISASVGSVFINALVVKFAVVISVGHVRMVVVIPTVVYHKDGPVFTG